MEFSMYEATPGVERAVAAAKHWAQKLGPREVRLVDYLLGLLEEEEGRPALLLQQLDFELRDIRETLEPLVNANSGEPAASLPELYEAARAWSVAHRADPVFMTDAFLVAILRADSDYWRRVPGFHDLARRIETSLASEDSPVAGANEPPAAFELLGEVEDLTAARIVDANLNRGREALRVLEDYCRFALDDRFLTGQVKESRHALADAAKRLPESFLLGGRETQHDVGTDVTAAGEYRRGSPREVAAVNLKRLQESLRSLEEYGKLFGPEFAREIETIRYRAYTLERAIAIGSNAREKLEEARLYVLLTGSQCALPLEMVIERAAAGGADIFQLREKELPDRELIERARSMRRWTRKADALFIVNDRPDIARLVEADGVHLGQDDLSVRETRRIIGPDALIGVSRCGRRFSMARITSESVRLFPRKPRRSRHSPGWISFARQWKNRRCRPSPWAALMPGTLAMWLRRAAGASP
jgi:thiamine-phosphate pyrophosphorylase